MSRLIECYRSPVQASGKVMRILNGLNTGVKPSVSSGGALMIPVNSRKIVRVLCGILFLLVLANMVVVVIKHKTGHDNIYGIVPLFLLNQESNIPTYVSSFNLLLASVLLGVITRVKRNQRDAYTGQWAFLAFLFLYFSLDETACIHELLNKPLLVWLGPQGPLLRGTMLFAWVILAVPLVLIFAVLFLRFLLANPPKSRFLF